MQAIITKYYGPTNTRGSRIKAKAAAGFAWHSWDHELTADENHRAAAEKLCKALGWIPAETNAYTTLVQGQLPDGTNVFTFIPECYEKAKQAVFESRYAISKGENNGNPHCRAWGKAITNLTDADRGGVWAAEYELMAETRYAYGK